nr:hypothetical protein [Paraburkholderia aspalathi]
MTNNGKKHWLWRAVDRHSAVIEVLVTSSLDKATQTANAQAAQAPRQPACHRDGQAAQLRGGEQ